VSVEESCECGREPRVWKRVPSVASVEESRECGRVASVEESRSGLTTASECGGVSVEESRSGLTTARGVREKRVRSNCTVHVTIIHSPNTSRWLHKPLQVRL